MPHKQQPHHWKERGTTGPSSAELALDGSLFTGGRGAMCEWDVDYQLFVDGWKLAAVAADRPEVGEEAGISLRDTTGKRELDTGLQQQPHALPLALFTICNHGLTSYRPLREACKRDLQHHSLSCCCHWTVWRAVSERFSVQRWDAILLLLLMRPTQLELVMQMLEAELMQAKLEEAREEGEVCCDGRLVPVPLVWWYMRGRAADVTGTDVSNCFRIDLARGHVSLCVFLAAGESISRLFWWINSFLQSKLALPNQSMK